MKCGRRESTVFFFWHPRTGRISAISCRPPPISARQEGGRSNTATVPAIGIIVGKEGKGGTETEIGSPSSVPACIGNGKGGHQRWSAV